MGERRVPDVGTQVDDCEVELIRFTDQNPLQLMTGIAELMGEE
jgi:hypothetical protein